MKGFTPGNGIIQLALLIRIKVKRAALYLPLNNNNCIQLTDDLDILPEMS
jgi:hypothetical protein